MNTTWLLEAAIRSLIMGALALVALQLLQIHQVKAQRTAWLLALAAALLMPWLVAAHIGPRVLPSSLRADDAEFSVESGLARSAPIEPVEWTASANNPQPASFAESSPLRAVAADAAVRIYFVIAIVLLARLGLGLAMALRLKSRAKRAENLAIRADVRISAQLRNPVTITSCIVLPDNYLTWDAATLRIVLSHEFAHVRQKDFYVQLLAGLHCALFWFSPFSWWLKRQLSDLGEALSDHAASQQADSRASYAEVLLAFASGAHQPFVAVAMARASSLTPRIERLLNDGGFERSFSGKPRLTYVAATVVIAALLASTAVQNVDATPLDAPPADVPTDGGVSLPNADDDEIFVIKNGNSRVLINGDLKKRFGRDMHLPDGDFILYQRNGKPYLIKDPAILGKAHELLAPLREMGQRQAEIGAEISKRQSSSVLRRELREPDFKTSMEEISKMVEEMKSDKSTLKMDQKALNDLQNKLGGLQGRLGRLQAEIAMQNFDLPDLSGELNLERERFGHENQRILEEVQRELKPAIEQAIKDGKVRPLTDSP